MDDIPILGHGDADRLFKEFQSQYGAPAYVRRALAVEEALERLVGRCRQQRDKWLPLVRTRLGVLHGLAGDWIRLRPWLAEEDQVDLLQNLHATLEPRLRAPVHRTSSHRALRGALWELKESLELFNRRWAAYLPTVDLTHVNELRDGYNRYYLLEKECALRSARVARGGFRPLEPLTLEELAALLPPLPVPRLR